MMNDREVACRFELACSVSREAGAIALRYFQKNPDVEAKADNSPVTIADREGELCVRRAIEAAFPQDGILGEEYGEKPGTSGFRWTIDPIDGTKSFVCGVPLFGTMIAVQFDGRSVAGTIYLPCFDELYAAREGGGTFCNGQPCQVSQTAELRDAVMVGTGIEYSGDRWGDIFQQLLPQLRFYRTWGDCYGWTLLLRGRIDIMFDPGLREWDCAPLRVLVAEAGGRFFSQDRLQVPGVINCLGANAALMDQIQSQFSRL